MLMKMPLERWDLFAKKPLPSYGDVVDRYSFKRLLFRNFRKSIEHMTAIQRKGN